MADFNLKVTEIEESILNISDDQNKNFPNKTEQPFYNKTLETI